MEELVQTLMQYGFSFTYENKNSNGEKIQLLDLPIAIVTADGSLFFENEGLIIEVQESPEAFDDANCKLEELLIEATSTF
jgi:hypothetical protein